MSKLKNGNGTGSAKVFRFSLTRFIILCLCLISAASFITGKVVGARQKYPAGPAQDVSDVTRHEQHIVTQQGPWGELLSRDISLERPAEYLNDELKTVQPPLWTFHGMNVAQVKTLFVTNGLTSPEADKALAPDRVSTQGTNTVFKPSDEFVLSLNSETRERLYPAMRGLEVNPLLDSPYYYAKDQIEWMNGDARVDPNDLALFKKLVYGKTARHFSDYETLMGRIPTLERRAGIAASLSRQSAVLAGLCIRPDTDIDKVAGYWGSVPNVRFIDIRPMIEGLKRSPRGGTVSLMYLLPPFARERLYTFPARAVPGEPTPDSFWSTFNFSNVEPDKRFFDLAECIRYLDQNFYPIAQPGICGDVLLFKNSKGQIRHSAVYIAADLVFTKNGKNCLTPWVFMRIADLQAMYSNCNIVYFRNKTD
jgi:hypothetical protein